MAVSCECSSLDALLGGELEPGVVTLAYGIAGSGKTNLALQVARTAAKGGLRTAYIDSEGVSAQRLVQLFNGRAKLQDKLLFSRVVSLEEQMATTEDLHDRKVKDLGLVVEDTVNGLARLGQLEEKELTDRQFRRILKALTTLAHEKDIPVLITAQVWETEEGEVHPFYMKSLEHLPKAIVRLEKRTEPNHRRAVLVKHRSQPERQAAEFEITQGGLVC